MAYKALPSPDLLRQLLRYEPDTGKLFWRERTPSIFEDGTRSSAQRCHIWNRRFSGGEAFTTVGSHGYKAGTILWGKFLAHRVIWAMVYGEWPDEVDHINHMRTDNRISNLRSVSRSGNQRNKAIPRNNTSGVMGVFWHDPTSLWRARIRANGENVHLGLFEKIEDAAAARKAAEKRYGYHFNHGS